MVYNKVEIPEEESEKKSFTNDTSLNDKYKVSEDGITRRHVHDERPSKGLLVEQHFKEAMLSLHTAWVLQEGKCYEEICMWSHTKKDLKDAPHLEKVLHAMENQLDKLTDGDYSRFAAALDTGEDGHDCKYWWDFQDIYCYIYELREGRYHRSGNPKYEGRRGIPRIETTGRRIYDIIMQLIWKMDHV